jgi:hypothetical protein
VLETLITSKTRIKLLLKFFLNPETSAYLRSLESEFGESSNAIRLELNRFEDAKMLRSSSNGNKKLFQANNTHPLFKEINQIVRKFIGLDVIIDNVLKRIGNLHTVYLTGDLAQGKDSQFIDLLIVGEIDKHYLIELIEKAEKLIQRKIRFVIYSPQEALSLQHTQNEALLLYNI